MCLQYRFSPNPIYESTESVVVPLCDSDVAPLPLTAVGRSARLTTIRRTGVDVPFSAVALPDEC